MPAILSYAKNFRFTSDFPVDQIIGFMSGSVTAANGAVETVDYPHGFSFTPLPTGSWSLTTDFDATYPAITDYIGNGARPSVTVQANGSVLRVTVGNYTGSSKTVYWRAFLLMPAAVDVAVAPTAGSTRPFIINSDYNYTKLLTEGYVTANSTVGHGLGYRPQVALWGQTATGFVGEYEIADGTPSPLSTRVEITTNDLELVPGSLAGIHYRIYIDE